MSSNELQPTCELIRIDQSALDMLTAHPLVCPELTNHRATHRITTQQPTHHPLRALAPHQSFSLQIVPGSLRPRLEQRPNILPPRDPDQPTPALPLANGCIPKRQPVDTRQRGRRRRRRCWSCGVVVVRASGGDEFRYGVGLGAAAGAGERGVIDGLGEAKVGELDEHG